MDIADLRAPLLLSADNFTPLKRTPWGGHRILGHYKKDLLSRKDDRPVGESWEFSCDPEMPSYVQGKGGGVNFSRLLETSAADILSPFLARERGCEILVKLLDTKAPLSFQVHPDDQDPDLSPDECGKPESWLILHAEPGAGIYLGFKEPVSKETLRELIRNGTDLSRYLQFVPVRENDYFEIAPGVPHAIGPGLTLLEPQRILSGKSGKTYRMWDWNRRYSAEGREVQGLHLQRGQARPLHTDACLRLVRPEQHWGEGFVRQLKSVPIRELPAPGVKILSFPANKWYRSRRVWMAPDQAALTLRFNHAGYGFLLVLEGCLELLSESGYSAEATAGQPVLLPWAGRGYRLTSRQAETDFVLITPSLGREGLCPSG